MNTSKGILVTVIYLMTFCILSPSLLAEYRIWTNKEGKTLSAELVTLSDTEVTLKLKKNRKQTTIAIDTLSAADQDFLIALKLENKTKAQNLKDQAFIIAGNKIKPGQVTNFKIPVVTSKGKNTSYPAGLLVPKDFDPINKDYNLVFVFVAGEGNPIAAIKGNSSLLQVENTIIAAVHHMSLQTTLPFIDFYRILTEKWPRMTENKWRQMHFGFSGGAKNGCWATGVFINEGANVVGSFMGGCNEDLSERARGFIKKSSDRKKVDKIAFFLSSGAKDKIANPQQHQKVMDSLKNNGAKNVKLESHPGAHFNCKPHQVPALKWMIEIADAQEK
ncbi:MAG: hypothetical protein ACSHX6_10980 [Akkermansiaceae bacterium]